MLVFKVAGCFLSFGWGPFPIVFSEGPGVPSPVANWFVVSFLACALVRRGVVDGSRAWRLGHGAGAELAEVFNRFKLVAEQKTGGVSDDDLMAILSDELYQPVEIWKLLDLQVRRWRALRPAYDICPVNPRIR